MYGLLHEWTEKEIRNWVRLMGPNTLISAFNTARNVEVALGRKPACGALHDLGLRVKQKEGVT